MSPTQEDELSPLFPTSDGGGPKKLSSPSDIEQRVRLSSLASSGQSVGTQMQYLNQQIDIDSHFERFITLL